MMFRQETMIKIFSVVITAMLNVQSTTGKNAYGGVKESWRLVPADNLKLLSDSSRNGYQGIALRDFNNPTMAKRGGHRVVFKGEEFEKETFATKHQDIVLECEAGGSPSPTIHWLKDGDRIQQGVSHDNRDDSASFEDKVGGSAKTRMLRLGKVKSRLFLDCPTDRDMGEYTCVGETPYEKITQSTELVMGNSLSAMSRPDCVTKKAFRGEPARIHLWTSVRLEFQGAPVQLFCRADGYPAPTCSWKYTENGPTIVDDENYKNLENGDLLIYSISWDNMGDYYCTCENQAGIDQVSTFLYPTSP